MKWSISALCIYLPFRLLTSTGYHVYSVTCTYIYVVSIHTYYGTYLLAFSITTAINFVLQESSTWADREVTFTSPMDRQRYVHICTYNFTCIVYTFSLTLY